jgi:hypothetical protein
MGKYYRYVFEQSTHKLPKRYIFHHRENLLKHLCNINFGKDSLTPQELFQFDAWGLIVPFLHFIKLCYVFIQQFSFGYFFKDICTY